MSHGHDFLRMQSRLGYLVAVEWPGLPGGNHHFSVAKGSLAARLGIKDLEVGSTRRCHVEISR